MNRPTPFWPVVVLEFPEPPEGEAWDVFAAEAGALLPVLGLEESPPERVDGRGPDTARLFFGSVQSEDSPLPWLAPLRELATARFAPGSFRLAVEIIPNRDWGEEWRENFHVRRIGRRLWVGPPWQRELPAGAGPDAIHVVIEPAQAFGTGSHETTRLCLEVLEDLVPAQIERQEDGAALLDVGTGSGILAIAAVKLGARFAVGVEYDPVCEENFRLNASLNGVAAKVRFVLSSDPLDGPAVCLRERLPLPTLTVCNMLSERFLPILPLLSEIAAPLLLSGFLLSEEKIVRDALAGEGLRVLRSYDLDEWGAFYCQRET